MKKYLIIANNGPEDPNRATVPFLTAKALVEKKIPIYIGTSCAMGRGLLSEDQEPLCTFVCGELGVPSQLADLIVDADNVIGF